MALQIQYGLSCFFGQTHTRPFIDYTGYYLCLITSIQDNLDISPRQLIEFVKEGKTRHSKSLE